MRKVDGANNGRSHFSSCKNEIDCCVTALPSCLPPNLRPNPNPNAKATVRSKPRSKLWLKPVKRNITVTVTRTTDTNTTKTIYKTYLHNFSFQMNCNKTQWTLPPLAHTCTVLHIALFSVFCAEGVLVQFYFNNISEWVSEWVNQYVHSALKSKSY